MKRGLNKLGQEFCNQRLLTVRSRQLKLTLCDCHLNLGQTPSKTTGLFQDLTQQRGYGTTARGQQPHGDAAVGHDGANVGFTPVLCRKTPECKPAGYKTRSQLR